MAYIEYHQELRWLWKVERTAQDLQIAKPHALGLVSALWLWCVGNAPDGRNLTRFTDREISAACGWEGDEQLLRVILRKHRWLDAPQDDVHEWDNFGLRLLRQSRERKHRFEESNKNVLRNVPKNVTRNVRPGKKERKIEREKEQFVNKEPTTKETVHSELAHQRLINRYLELSGTPRTALTPAQVTGAYKRHSRSALALLNEAGGVDQSLNAVEVIAVYFTKKRLTWTLDTVAKHLPKLEGYRHELLADRNGLSPHQLDQLRQLATWYQSKTQSPGAHPHPRLTAPGIPDLQPGPGAGVDDAV